MTIIFKDISKYYAASISSDILTVGRIIDHEGGYFFSRLVDQGPFNLVAGSKQGGAPVVQVIGEIHPLGALDKISKVDVSSCLFLSENLLTDEIEVRSIHKGMGTSIYSKQECPLILWNRDYADNQYFDVIDIQQVFPDPMQKHIFVAFIATSLHGQELFPPLLHFRKNDDQVA